MISLRFQMETYPCNRGLRRCYDIVAFSPSVPHGNDEDDYENANI